MVWILFATLLAFYSVEAAIIYFAMTEPELELIDLESVEWSSARPQNEKVNWKREGF